MNLLIPRFLRKAYRKEPLSSFILIVGAVDAVMGGVGGRISLFSVGIGMTLLAVVLRWWQTQAVSPVITEDPPTHYLPPSSHQPPLPRLSQQKHRR